MPSRPASRARRAPAANAAAISRSCSCVARSASKPCSGSDLLGRAEPLAIEIQAADVPLPARMRELEDVLAVVLVHPLAELAPEGNRPVVVDACVVRHDESARLDSAPGGDDRADAPAGELELPVDPASGSPIPRSCRSAPRCSSAGRGSSPSRLRKCSGSKRRSRHGNGGGS